MIHAQLLSWAGYCLSCIRIVIVCFHHANLHSCIVIRFTLANERQSNTHRRSTRHSAASWGPGNRRFPRGADQFNKGGCGWRGIQPGREPLQTSSVQSWLHHMSDFAWQILSKAPCLRGHYWKALLKRPARSPQAHGPGPSSCHKDRPMGHSNNSLALKQSSLFRRTWWDIAPEPTP